MKKIEQKKKQFINYLNQFNILFDNEFVDIKNRNSLFMWALVFKHDLVYEMTLEKDEINHINNNGNTALMLAVKWHNSQMILYLLDKYPEISINQQDNSGNTALSYAILFHYVSEPVRANAMKKILLKRGADPNLLNVEGQNIFEIESYQKKVLDCIVS